jgi:hypothetical protein
MDYVSLLMRSAMAKLDAERRGRERFGSRSVDAAAPGRLKLSRRAWNEYACAIAKGGTSTINLDENPCLQRSHQGCGVILGSRSSFRNAFIRHRGTPRVRRTLAGLCRGLRRLRPWIESTDGVHNIRVFYTCTPSTPVAGSGVKRSCAPRGSREHPKQPTQLPTHECTFGT